jgi:hypothetical protein
MRNRKYVEMNGCGRLFWVGAELNKKEISKHERLGIAHRTGREVKLETDFSVQGDWSDWDREAGYRIGQQLDETVEVARL